MGVVYLATRGAEDFEQQVAIKLIRHGVDTEEVVGRVREAKGGQISRIAPKGALQILAPFHGRIAARAGRSRMRRCPAPRRCIRR